MKRKVMRESALPRVAPGIKVSPQGSRALSGLLVLVSLVLALGMTQGTLGRFSQAFLVSDSALAAKFDIDITLPDAFIREQDGDLYEYYFVSAADIQTLAFRITNRGEAAVLCSPQINNGVMYRVYVAAAEQPEFVVKAGESVEFSVLIGPAGLDTNIRDAALFIDVRQLEGG